MQYAPNSSGDAELVEVVQSCVRSSERHIFVVGPSRSGKSTRLLVILAAVGGQKVISVQEHDWIARYHAEWIRESARTNTYEGKRPTVGYYADSTYMENDFEPEFDVNFVSYRWLYRMVVDANRIQVPSMLESILESETEKKAKAKSAESKEVEEQAKVDRANVIGYVVLDELQSQSVTQELGYLAIHSVISGLVTPPKAFSKGIRVMSTTAYPENDTFTERFGLSKEQIAQRTITIRQGLSPTSGNPVEEQYVSESDSRRLAYHLRAIKKVKSILEENKEARVLLFTDTRHSVSRHHLNQARDLQSTATVIDLDAEPDRELMASMTTTQKTTGRLLILATPSFASRLPVEGITDVVCPPTQLIPQLEDKILREVLMDIYLARWELTWAKNHLDRSSKRPTIHYMFRESLRSDMWEVSGARFRGGDHIDILLGMIRLCPDHVFANPPARFKMHGPTVERALYQLTVMPPTVLPSIVGASAEQESYVMSDAQRIEPMLNVADRCGLDRRQAFFLGLVEQKVVKSFGAISQGFTMTVAVAMVVFGENPFLRRSVAPKGIDDTKAIVASLKDCFHFGGKRKDFVSDAWTNAIVWMDLKRRASAARASIADFARQNWTSKTFTLDDAPLRAAESRLRLLADVAGLSPSYQDALCDGSFLQHVERFSGEVHTEQHQDILEVLWSSYLEAYQFNLVYVRMSNNKFEVIDISSHCVMDYAWGHLAIDLQDQLILESVKGRDGFYATASMLLDLRVRNLTVIPAPVLREHLDGDDANNTGSWDLHAHLKL
ncbi:hypothetical protein F5Y01DRAFT_284080, partial [Xylaria sp. FL0043]